MAEEEAKLRKLGFFLDAKSFAAAYPKVADNGAPVYLQAMDQYEFAVNGLSAPLTLSPEEKRLWIEEERFKVANTLVPDLAKASSFSALDKARVINF